LKFDVTNDPEMKLTVWDEEKHKKHDLVGDTVYFLNRITNDGIKEEEIEITFKGKSAGKVKLEFEWKPSNVMQMGMQNALAGKLKSAGFPGLGGLGGQ
jgi:Ca2+-dependent lipid-binding protein